MFKMHHITILVRDLDESVRFYEMLGFKKSKTIYDNEPKIIILNLNSILLEMKEYREFDINSNNNIDVKRIGLSVESIIKAKKYIEDNNLSNEEIIIKKGVLEKNYFFIKDPNNILIEIIEN